ncbi:MAG: heme ABC transporter ATP-binding protein [Pseudomonadota bacterium]
MLEATGLSLRYGATVILDEVGFSLGSGEVVALIGPNGAGKSTLLACLSGALRADHGRVRMDGADPARLRPAELALRRAVLEQTPAISAPFRVGELIGLALPREIPPRRADQLVGRASEALGLSDLLARRVSQLSGGEHHRAHMARVLAQLWAGQEMGGGRWLLLDEPTASLDLAHQNAVLLAARVAAKEGAGVLAVLHDLTLAAAVADRIVLMHRGRIVANGTAKETLTPEILSSVYGVDVWAGEVAPSVFSVTPLFVRNEET